MSNFHFGKKKLFIKQFSDLNNEGILNLNRSVENNLLLENYSKGSSYLNNINNIKNDITEESQKHFSPPSIRSPVLLPKISNIFKKTNNSQKKSLPKIMAVSSSFSNLNPQGIFKVPHDLGKILKKDKTEISVLENEETNNKLLNNNLNINNNVQQINNITNINIHIYSNNSKENDDNFKDEIITSKLNNTNNTISSNSRLDNKQNQDIITNNSLINNTINNINNLNTISKKKSIFSYKKEKTVKRYNYNNKNIYETIGLAPYLYNNISFEKNTIANNKNNLYNYNNKITNNLNNTLNKELNNTSKKYYKNSLPDINLNINQPGMTINEKNKLASLGEKIINNSLDKGSFDINRTNIIDIHTFKKSNSNDNNSLEFNNIDISMNFLRDISSDSAKFILFLKLIQIHMDISILIDSSERNNGTFRRKLSSIINNEIIFKLNTLLNSYFNILTIIYNGNNNILTNKSNNIYVDCFFLFSSLNSIFHKIIKIQICLYSSMLITLKQLGQYDLNNMIKNYFNKIIKEISSPLLNFFEYFIKEDINLNYPDLIKNNLKEDFLEHIFKLNKIKKKTNYKNSEILMIISKNIDKSFESIKDYSLLNLKNSLIKPFGDAIYQMISSIDKKTLYQFVSTFLKTILFGELEINKKKVIQNSINFDSKFPNLKDNINNINNMNYLGSSFFNNVNPNPPYLPPINPQYKYTLVLDMDETLVHFFFTHINGMFFVRPYCFEFLNELNHFYEIITFTAGTKEYADNILNQLDINDNIIKYRLYRQHTTIMGFSSYKDLSNLGRDLSKIIIIDNLKENFKMQPNNGIFIKTWTSDVNDTQFKDLLIILKDIAIYNVDDVRPIIKKMNEEIKFTGSLINPYSNIKIEKIIGEISNIKN